jgi:hypothetical protein
MKCGRKDVIKLITQKDALDRDKGEPSASKTVDEGEKKETLTSIKNLLTQNYSSAENRFIQAIHSGNMPDVKLFVTAGIHLSRDRVKEAVKRSQNREMVRFLLESGVEIY